MWGHYSDGNRGLIIEIEINDEDAVLKPIQYLNEIISLDIEGSSPREKAQTILSAKLEAWKYEKEQRIFIPNSFVKVNIKEVILGSRMPQETKKDMKNLLNKLNDKIKISEQSI